MRFSKNNNIENKQLKYNSYLIVDELKKQKTINNDTFIKMYNYIKIIFKTIEDNYDNNYNIFNSPFDIKFLIKYKKLKGGKFHYLQK